MSTSRRWITLLLAIIAVVLIGWNLTNQDTPPSSVVQDDQSPTYTIATSDTVAYNPEGGLAYKLDSDKVSYFDTPQVSWFDNPVMTTYDQQKAPAWSVKADKAKLTKNRMLYLYGHVEVNALNADAKIERIITDNAQVNLVTQDVTSDDQVTLYGQGFQSTGMKLRGNLRAKTAELIEKVKTDYEIQNQKK
ncbi:MULTISPECIES: LPS export ABC transporter periplasmic protein LptC [Tatumella]|uniref:Lipopolysaccharide export system protein LptC n=1 Tax=Tatumella punctata TaxID=399969 RepID=A0ABW1VJC0_9GAMM|nr:MULTISPECIES: LPS export ABC transporter periplasmic protein LptC [unclassified Tatumella]MBS0856438.1 LPS export ABC transporter periplasmic protein LptC [Tatumella sp. JGM16]MBS0877344.1 LPS export ABC transporter periplasmic protein LptC [Tatumella sp. JGM82]MBS0890783.1 LPS export ABC transporter periplasmic protein LptC [Tatumella sp. JGM94]MBS0893431.1 LPS export ABC transporter periplasmic protein LptC [Tatumella sp. JGM130]MBS0901741.1 LPS export ABC transporter periplasmic protein 